MPDDVVVKMVLCDQTKGLTNLNVKYVVTLHVICTDGLLQPRRLGSGEIRVTSLLFTQHTDELQSITNGA
jgi:hypothetical protein